MYIFFFMYIRINKITAAVKKFNAAFAVKKFNAAFSELSELGCYDEISVRKIAAAGLLQKLGYEYPKEWEMYLCL